MILAGTGHRPDKLGGYGPSEKQTLVRAAIREKLIELKPERVISGFALGFDQWFAEEAMRLGIPVTAAVPFIGQESTWPWQSQSHYKDLISKCAEVVVVCEGRYGARKMQIRNEWMVDHSNALLAVWDGSNGGTANCIRYADSIDHDLHRIDPTSLTLGTSITKSELPRNPPGHTQYESENEAMSFLTMVAKAKASNNNDGDFFLPDLKGEIDIERIFEHNGDKGTSVILVGTVVSCEAKNDGAVKHAVGAKVKKIYAISKFPTVAPGQLKGDILAIDGLKEDDLSAKDTEAMLGAIFEDEKSPMFELRGYRVGFDTRVIDRSAKKKENLTGVLFKHVENKPEEMAARASEITKRLAAENKAA